MAQRVAIVTGAARGIGAAIAGRLVRDGFRVAVADLDDREARTCAGRIAGDDPAAAFAVHVDVADPASVAAMVEAAVACFGRIDALVNNAGITGGAAPVVEYPIEEWRRVLAIDLDGVF